MGLAPSRVESVRAETIWNLNATRAHFAGMTTITATAETVPSALHGPRDRLPILMLGAVGVVYGDIGTSPLYAMKESFIGPHPMGVDRLHIFGVLSLIFWSLTLIVTVNMLPWQCALTTAARAASLALWR